MACSIDHLKKVASEGFPLTDKLYGWQAGKAHRRAPPPVNHDHYHHHQKQQVPNQYVYHGPQTVTVVLDPDTGSSHKIPSTKNYERWYVCQVSQAPTVAGTAAISSNDPAAYCCGMQLI
ncbi:hypothetical protein PTKIN_Ptkin09bG0016800 [Pterospermum kingtungense]